MTGYRRAGVDLAGADRHVQAIGSTVTATWGADVIGKFGGFAAGIRIPAGYRDPILMLTTDGVGTKLELARRYSRWDGVGYDLVAMVVDDLAAVGARPIAVVDYLAVGQLEASRDIAIVDSIARACREAGTALLGGETAEHPGVMEPDQVDLAATALGVIENGAELGPEKVRRGDVIVGLRSPNLRSNGFSLVRSIIGGRDLDASFPGEDASLEEVLLLPSVLYSPRVQPILGLCHAAAHVTGGGLPGNLPRVLPEGLGAVIQTRAWEVPGVFRILGEWGEIPEMELFSVFNMGIGFCLIVPPATLDQVVAATAGVEIGQVVDAPGVILAS